MTTDTMAETKPTKPKAKPPIAARFTACLQNRGGIGKSTFGELLISFYHRTGIEFDGFDADGSNRTLARRYPDDVEAFNINAKKDEEFNRLAQTIQADFPVTFVDFPGNAHLFILEGFERLRLVDLFEAKGIRPTLLLFANDDQHLLAETSTIRDYFGDRADYVIVENQGVRLETKTFYGSPMFKWFTERGTPVLVMPEVQPSTMRSWEALERKTKQPITLDAACRHDGLGEIARAELEYLRDHVSVQLERHAERILPNAKLIKTPLPKAIARKTIAPTDPFEDPNY
jgi:hypothetical protein